MNTGGIPATDEADRVLEATSGEQPENIVSLTRSEFYSRQAMKMSIHTATKEAGTNMSANTVMAFIVRASITDLWDNARIP